MQYNPMNGNEINKIECKRSEQNTINQRAISDSNFSRNIFLFFFHEDDINKNSLKKFFNFNLTAMSSGD